MNLNDIKVPVKGKQLIFFSQDMPTVSQDDDEPDKMRVQGYFLKYNVISYDRGNYRSVFRPNCFKSLVRFDEALDVKALLNHDDNAVLARTDNGSLVLSDDPNIGVKYNLMLPNTTLGRDCAELIKHNLIKGCSFGVIPDEDGYDWKDEDDGIILEFLPAKNNLVEMSFVYDPAIPFTTVSAYSVLGRDAREQEKIHQSNLNKLLLLSL